LFGCNQQPDSIPLLQKRVDSLERKIQQTYKPGFGEFMSSVQVHHNKLWFAAQNKNWKLADFEVHEIMEALDDIRKYETDRKESQMIGIINPVLDSVNAAIQQQNIISFNNNFVVLTNTCNQCHKATGFEFNVIKIPGNPPFSNQEFKTNTVK
jgi:hypothetical protein